MREETIKIDKNSKGSEQKPVVNYNPKSSVHVWMDDCKAQVYPTFDMKHETLTMIYKSCSRIENREQSLQGISNGNDMCCLANQDENDASHSTRLP